MKQQTHRHGEVVLKPATMPEGVKLIQSGNDLIIGHSESGHHHVLTLEKNALAKATDAVIKIFEFEGKSYLDIPLEAQLVHQKEFEKHATQVIQPGIYERIIRHSYSYAEKIMKRVID